MARNYSELASIVPLRQDNGYMVHVRIRSRGKTVSDPCPRRARHRSSEQVHHPNAIYHSKHYILVIILRSTSGREGSYLVIKATMAIEVIEECRISLSTPKVHISNFKIAPNYVCLFICLSFL